jgi:hypothetical protein
MDTELHRLTDAAENAGAAELFMTAISSGTTLIRITPNDYDSAETEFDEAIADAMKVESHLCWGQMGHRALSVSLAPVLMFARWGL